MSYRVIVLTVLAHAAAVLAHGAAHARAQVGLSPAGNAFVLLVIVLAPLAALVVWRWNPLAGALLLATSMPASLLFGLINHYLVQGADHVAHVASPFFGITAALVLATEAIGTAVGVTALVRRTA